MSHRKVKYARMTLAYHTIASDFALDDMATSGAGIEKQFTLQISLTVLQHLIKSVGTRLSLIRDKLKAQFFR